ncbi:unnamed protein product [Hydatigera taeniaeformis]|uniref:Uncharacterized protein n=1 Tax=Hydatigena taeniaeformis TaxID=6205 RepID=A0A3P7HDR2_HYDTA|nr:unnamed protein product [Hydatigera taeniaeformis]
MSFELPEGGWHGARLLQAIFVSDWPSFVEDDGFSASNHIYSAGVALS